MKKANSLLFFILFLFVAILAWFLIYNSISVPRKSNSINSKLEEIRTLSIGENTVEIRRAVEIPEHIKDMIREMIDQLKESPDQFSDLEKVEIVKVIGSFGKRASFASSTLLNLFLKSEPSIDTQSIYFQSLLALIRVTKSPESVENAFHKRCVARFDVQTEKGNITPELYVCAAMLRLGLVLPKEIKDKVETFFSEQFTSSYAKVKEWNLMQNLNLEDSDSIVLPACLYSQILSKEQVTLSEEMIQSILKSSQTRHAKITALSCVIDQANKSSDLLDEVSHVMQFSSDKELRKESLLTLLHIGSERSLELAKAYGHKFINGEPPPEVTVNHPFREWAIESQIKTDSTQ